MHEQEKNRPECELDLGGIIISPQETFLAALSHDYIRGRVCFPSVIATIHGDIELEIYAPVNPEEDSMMMQKLVDGSPIPVDPLDIHKGLPPVIGEKDYLAHTDISGKDEARRLFEPLERVTVRSLNGNITLTVYDPSAIVDTYSDFGGINVNPQKYRPDKVSRRIAAETYRGSIKISYVSDLSMPRRMP